ncbi:MAG: ATP-binding protein [bacterium]|nr:ATP-binding protein [bacterium]
MQNETRVNLKHLLEDIRDSYNAPLEEVIITELIANALDSKATRLDFFVDEKNCFLRCVDNGVGMKRPKLREYHNIAASTKTRGQGIGFAGVGAKLSLLLADKVTTESRGGHGSRAATEWRLTNPYRAPWKFVPFSETIPYPKGTSVTIYFTDSQAHLLKRNFVGNTIIKHFYPLFHDYLKEEILRYIYKKGIEMTVNGELLSIPDSEQRIDNGFKVYLGKGRRPIGAGFLTKKVLEQGWLARLAGKAPDERVIASGLSVATYGKVIKTGWEWVGIMPKSAVELVGVLEIPALSEVLTTNKSDFLSDAVNLRRFYRIRKAVQQAVLPVLRSLGEYGSAEKPSTAKNIKPLTRQIENALQGLSSEYPELESLLGAKRVDKAGTMGRKGGGEEKESPASPKEKTKNEDIGQEGVKESAEEKSRQDAKPKKGGEGTAKKPGFTLVLEDLADMSDSLGRVVEDTISVNTLHPMWRKAIASKQEEYHILVVVGLLLSDFAAPEHHPRDFLAKFLSSWSTLNTDEQKSVQGKLLE